MKKKKVNELKENSNKRNLKEKIKIFGKNLNKNWVWVNIGAYGAWMISSWSLFFVGILDLGHVIFSTILGLAIFYLVYILKHIRKRSTRRSYFLNTIWISIFYYLDGGGYYQE